MKSSRRNFLLGAVTAPLAAALAPGGQMNAEASGALPAAGQMHFDNPQMLRYDSKCFTFNGKDTLVMSTVRESIEYPRASSSRANSPFAEIKSAILDNVSFIRSSPLELTCTRTPRLAVPPAPLPGHQMELHRPA